MFYSDYAKVPKCRNGTETALGLHYRACRFLSKANCVEKRLQSGAKREGQMGFGNKTFFSFGLV